MAASRSGPAASLIVGCNPCGSHLSQSQSLSRTGSAQTTMRRSSGAWNVASCASIERKRPDRASASPVMITRLNARSEIAIGSADTLAHALSSRRSAPADSGSRSSTGLVSGAMSGTARRCLPIATRTSAKSSSVGRRSHSRLPAAIDHRVDGSGCSQYRASRCAAATRRTRRRTWPRYRKYSRRSASILRRRSPPPRPRNTPAIAIEATT